MNSPLFKRLSVHLFSPDWEDITFFLIFLIKLGFHKRLKISEPFFLWKILILPEMG